MVVGTIDFTMAFDVFGLPGSKSSGNMGMDADMSMDMDGDCLSFSPPFPSSHPLFAAALVFSLGHPKIGAETHPPPSPLAPRKRDGC